jgi:hypothetical protein
VTPRLKAPRDLFGNPIRKAPDRKREAGTQIVIVHTVRAIAPHIRVFHSAQSGSRDDADAARFRVLGAMTGIFDQVLILPHGRVAWWEVKRGDGRLSDEQKAFVSDFERLGHSWLIVRRVANSHSEFTRLRAPTGGVLP